jgi:hypothetical protein
MNGRINQEFINSINAMGVVDLRNALIDLESELSIHRWEAIKLVEGVKLREATQDKSRAEDRIATEKANKEMRRHHKTNIEPLLERIARVQVLLITKGDKV